MAELSPTWDEFEDFNNFVEQSKTRLEECGYLLINPPLEWSNLIVKDKLSAFQEFEFRPKRVLFKANQDRSGFAISTEISSRGTRQTVSNFQQTHTAGCSTLEVNEKRFPNDDLNKWEAESGVDIKYDLFPDDLKVWNLNALGDFMSTKQRLEKDLPGMTSALVHVNSFGSASALQSEDNNLHSIIYIHEGQNIDWTVFPSREKHKIDALYPQIAPEHICEFNELERHKVGFINPLGKLAIGLQKFSFTQRAEQFVIISPAAYHQRLSKGFNITSSVSFGTEDWMLHVPDCTLCPGHNKGEGQDTDSCNEEESLDSVLQPANMNVSSKPQSDEYTFEEDDVPKPRRGRPRDPKKIENPAVRPTKMCPECRSIQDKNFDRHLNLHFDISTREGRREKEKAKLEAARRTVQGIRESHIELLPQSIWELLTKDPMLHFGFKQFLDDVGVAFPNLSARLTDKQKRKREELAEQDQYESEEQDEGDDKEHAPPGPKSARKRLQLLGYPPLDESKSLSQSLLGYSKKDHQRSTQIRNSLCQIKRILGYVDYMTEKKDSHGWDLLLNTDKIKEYIQIVRSVGGATASTAKNYVDKIITVMKLTQDTFFDDPGMPTDPYEHKKYMNSLKKATNEMTDFCHRKMEERDRELVVRKAQLGESLPDIASWEEYILDEENLSQFQDCLSLLETSADQDIEQLRSSPDKSPLREAFNFVVEFSATRQLFLAARPGELAKCTFAEITTAKSFRGALHINVASHKTGRIKQATIAIEKKDQETFLRYIAILRRFQPPPAFGFPFLSPTRGFVEHTKIYRRMNVWLEKRGKERFTCTKLRKTVETTVDLYGTARDKELVGSGLNHSAATIRKHYRVQTSEKSAAEKAAIKRCSAESKLRTLFEKRPIQFTVNILEGPLKQDKLTCWAKAEMNAEDLVVGDELYSVYLTNWRIVAKPLMVEECRSALLNGTTLKEIESVLSSPVYEGIKADILMELRQINQLTLLQPCVLLDKTVVT